MSAERAARKIEHVFVLMLENRSYDHMLGFAGGACGPAPSSTDGCHLDPSDSSSVFVPALPVAPDRVEPDPPHEFHDVRFQLTGDPSRAYTPGMKLPGTGYAASARRGRLLGTGVTWEDVAAATSNGKHAVECQAGDSLKMLRFLAENYVVCRRWFSSMPGPTWPNRFFAHAATSGGLDNSPSRANSFWFTFRSKLHFSFPNGTVFEKLKDRWRVYHGDALPQVLTLKGMAAQYFSHRFRRLTEFANDVATKRMPAYVFIEPAHNVVFDGRFGDSQHPVGTVHAGDHVIEFVYNALRASPLWTKSMLIVTYDEHGGFFDREEPPVATPPDRDFRYRDRAEFKGNFSFDRLGVRVPAVVVSPWVESTHDDTVYDHSAIAKTLGDIFDFGPLTERDHLATSLTRLLVRETPRTSERDAPSTHFYGDAPLSPREPPSDLDLAAIGDGPEGDRTELASGNIAAFMHIAALLKQELRRRRLSPVARALLALIPRDLIPVRLPRPRNRREALRYIAEVEQLLLREQLDPQLRA